MFWKWKWKYAWRALRNRCPGCGSSKHVICWKEYPEVWREKKR
jgi:hypothetical protein